MDLRDEMRSRVRNYRSRNLMSTGHLILLQRRNTAECDGLGM